MNSLFNISHFHKLTVSDKKGARTSAYSGVNQGKRNICQVLRLKSDPFKYSITCSKRTIYSNMVWLLAVLHQRNVMPWVTWTMNSLPFVRRSADKKLLQPKSQFSADKMKKIHRGKKQNLRLQKKIRWQNKLSLVWVEADIWLWKITTAIFQRVWMIACV